MGEQRVDLATDPYRPPEEPEASVGRTRLIDDPPRLVASTRRWWRALGISYVVFGGLMVLVGGVVVAGLTFAPLINPGGPAPPAELEPLEFVAFAAFGGTLIWAGVYALIIAARLAGAESLLRSARLRGALYGFFALQLLQSLVGALHAALAR